MARPRLAREDWYRAGMAVADRLGADGLHMGEVAVELGRTHGAFSNYFDSWEEYLHGLLTFWIEERYRDTFLALYARDTDPAARIRDLIGMGLALPSDGRELRKLARKRPELAAKVSEGDKKAVAFLELLLADIGLPREHAQMRAWLLFSAFVGVNQIEPPVNEIKHLVTLLGDLVLSPPPPMTQTHQNRQRRQSRQRPKSAFESP